MSDDSNFFERIMELGIGISMARQMPDMLSHVMPGSQPAAGTGSQVPPQLPRETQFYLVVNNAQAGPFSEKDLQLMIQNGLLSRETLVWKTGMAQWARAEQVPEVNKLFLLSQL